MFKQSSTGLSISDEAIRFVRLEKSWGKFRLKKYGERKLPADVLKYGLLKDPEELGRILHTLKKEEKIKKAFVVLPEKDLGEDYLKDFKEVFKNIRIEIENFISEDEGVRKAVVAKNDPRAFLLLQLEKYRTGIFIVADERVAFSTTLDVGGETLIQTAEKSTFREKILNREIITEKVSSATLSGLSILREEVNKYFLRWHLKRAEQDPIRPMIEKIILVGREASLPGLVEYLAVSLKTKVELGNVWENILDPREKVPELPFKESLAYASALGGALLLFEA